VTPEANTSDTTECLLLTLKQLLQGNKEELFVLYKVILQAVNLLVWQTYDLYVTSLREFCTEISAAKSQRRITPMAVRWSGSCCVHEILLSSASSEYQHVRPCLTTADSLLDGQLHFIPYLTLLQSAASLLLSFCFCMANQLQQCNASKPECLMPSSGRRGLHIVALVWAFFQALKLHRLHCTVTPLS